MKKILAIVLALVLALSLAACGGQSAEPAPADGGNDTAPAAELVPIVVGASPAPHAEILESAKEVLKEKGYDLQVVEFTDYVLPNEALTAGELDANYFQHQPYLDTYNSEKGTDIVSAGAIHYEPLGVYPGKSSDINNVPEGAEIAVPNDGSNEARALYLLQDLGLIKVDNSNGFNITAKDITENPKNLKIDEVEAVQLPQVLPDVDFAIINGNYAIGAGIDGTVLTTESKDSDAAQTYANIIAVRNGEEKDEKIVALVEALQTEAVKSFINEKYGIAVVPMF